MLELFGKFKRQYSFKLYPYKKKKPFYSCLKLGKAISKNISNVSRYKLQKQLLNVFCTNSSY